MLVTMNSLNPHTSPLFKASFMSDNRLQCMSGYHEQSSHSQALSIHHNLRTLAGYLVLNVKLTWEKEKKVKRNKS